MDNMITIKAPAKLNLTLDVLGRREDGYHELASVMQTVSLFDKLTVSVAKAPRTAVKVKSNRFYLPSDEKNTAFVAASELLKAVGISAEVDISIKKRIPVGAGLGGGSSDAAAVLVALNSLLALRMSTDELIAIAAGIGADVPFLLLGGTALARGIGEKLTPLPTLKDVYFVLCKPKASVSTKALFAAYDLAPSAYHPDTAAAVSAVERGDRAALCSCIGNSLEAVSSALLPSIAQLRAAVEATGAEAAAMTGSGSAVFGIYRSFSDAASAAKTLRRRYSDTFVVTAI